MKSITYLIISFILINFFYANGMKKENIVDSPLIRAAKIGDLSSVDYILEDGVGLNEKDKDGRTALIWLAIRNHSVGSFKTLVECGADPNQKDNEGKTALMWAAGNGNLNFVEYLISKGKLVNINQRDKYGKTALMWAAGNRYHSTVKKLLEGGADCHLRSNCGATALTEILRGSYDIIDCWNNLLIENMMSVTLLQKKSFYTFLLCLKRLYKDEYPNLINLFKNQFGTLHQANWIDIGNELNTIKDTQLKRSVWDKFSPKLGNELIELAKIGNLKSIEALIRVGADLNFKDEDGDTALTWAVVHCHHELAKYLIDQGADVNNKDKEQITLLMDALEEGPSSIIEQEKRMVEFLIEIGVDPYPKSRSGKTALIYASKRKIDPQFFCEIIIEAMLEREKKDKSLKDQGANYQLNRIKDGELKNYLLEKYFSQEKN